MRPNLGSYKKLLDVGCGQGEELDRIDSKNIEINGIDIDNKALEIARRKYPNAKFKHASSIDLPYENGAFDAVISSVALPYTNIQGSLQEISRVLREDGYLWLSMHSFSMVFGYFIFYLRRLRIKPTTFTVYALINGIWFHFTGRTFCFFYNKKYESFQTKRGMRLALMRAGFDSIQFQKNGKLYIECKKGYRGGPISLCRVPQF